MGMHENNNIDENFTSFTFKKEVTPQKEDKNTIQEQTYNVINTLVQSMPNGNGSLSAQNNIATDNKLAKIEQNLEILLKKMDTPQESNPKNDEILMMMATKINQLESTLEHIQKSISQQKETSPQEDEMQEDIINALRTNNLFLSKIDQKIDQTQKIKLQEYQSNSEELLTTTQTYNLFLSKIEKKLDILYKLQQSPQKNESQEILEKYIQTNNLFLSKIDQKIELLARVQTQNNFKDILNEILESSKTNALYAAKSTQKIELFERTITQIKQTMTPIKYEQEFNEVYNKFETNSYLLSKLDQKLDLIQKNYGEQKNTLQNIQNTSIDKENEGKSIQQILNDLPNHFQEIILSIIQKENQNIENKQNELKNILQDELQNIQTNILKTPEVSPEIIILVEKQIQENNDLKEVLEQKNKKMNENFEAFKNQIFDWIKNHSLSFTDIITTFKIEVEKFFAQNINTSQQENKVLDMITDLKNNILNIPNSNHNFDNITDLLQNIKEEIIKKIHTNTPTPASVPVIDNTKILEEIQKNISVIVHQTQKQTELKVVLEGLENHIKDINTTIEQQMVQKNTITTVDMPAKEFWNDLKVILENNHKQLAQIEQNLSNFAKEKEQANPQNLLNGIHTNNLYLSKMEQKFENLLNKINHQQKIF